MVKSGLLSEDSLVFKKGMQQWTPLKQAAPQLLEVRMNERTEAQTPCPIVLLAVEPLHCLCACPSI